MESKVEMALEEYTNLIRENERLRALLRNCNRLLHDFLAENVKRYSIGKLTKEECDNALVMEPGKIVDKFGYDYTSKSAYNDYPCFSKEEIEKMYSDIIRNKIQERIEELEGA